MSRITDQNSRAVLFVLIGWGIEYDGTEAIVGNHRYLIEHPEENSESHAFVRQDDNYYQCGAGRGVIREKQLDIVFVARDVQTNACRAVGIYKNAEPIPSEEWQFVRTRTARLFPLGKRPLVEDWPKGQGVRRWAKRMISSGSIHESLDSLYQKLQSPILNAKAEVDPTDPELAAFEGELRRRFVAHRVREAKLRAAKIRQALEEGGGLLKCEVPGCGFDFLSVYGNIGQRFAVVHHLVPLGKALPKGTLTSLNNLAIVCPNCHAMVHRGGECRPIETLIPKRPSK